MTQQRRDPKGELAALVENAGGLASLAAYLETPPETLAVALNAPAGKRTDKVCAMVEENTRKLLLMPSQGGWIWKVTRRRVVKDWLILARWSAANGGGAVSPTSAPAPELSEEELQALEATAEIGDQAPPGYVWVNPDEVVEAMAADSIPEDTSFALFEPEELGLDQLNKVDLTTLLAWGIVNPFGPTLNAISLAGEFEPGEGLPILRVMLNPFAQQVELIGLATMGSTWNLLEDFRPLFALETGGCPTVLLAGEIIDEDREVVLFAQLLETFPDGATTLERVRRFPGDPWNRISEEVEGLSGILDDYQRTGEVTEEAAHHLSAEEAHELASALLLAENQGQEFAAFFAAWKGSIDFQRGNSVAQDALAFDDFVAYFSLIADSCRLPPVEGE